jgi:hypothetical protein
MVYLQCEYVIYEVGVLERWNLEAVWSIGRIGPSETSSSTFLVVKIKIVRIEHLESNFLIQQNFVFFFLRRGYP